MVEMQERHTLSHPAGWVIRAEVVTVVALAVGVPIVRSALRLVTEVLSPVPLPLQTASLNTSLAPNRPWLDLSLQLLFIVRLLLPVFLVVVLAGLHLEQLRDFGIRIDRWRREVPLGLLVAAVVGGVGLSAYLVGHAAGVSVTVIPTGLPSTWWRIPVLVLSAAANAALEEVVVVGYLLRRLAQLGWRPGPALWLSAGLRGCYHLYQGLAGALGNVVMGLIFGRYYQRTGSIGALFVAHAAIDIVAFVGYAVLAGRVDWLPT